jgi:hypothetical protein
MLCQKFIRHWFLSSVLRWFTSNIEEEYTKNTWRNGCDFRGFFRKIMRVEGFGNLWFKAIFNWYSGVLWNRLYTKRTLRTAGKYTVLGVYFLSKSLYWSAYAPQSWSGHCQVLPVVYRSLCMYALLAFYHIFLQEQSCCPAICFAVCRKVRPSTFQPLRLRPLNGARKPCSDWSIQAGKVFHCEQFFYAANKFCEQISAVSKFLLWANLIFMSSFSLLWANILCFEQFVYR